MHRFQKILVSTDTRFDDHPSVTEGAKIALQSGASLALVDVMPPLSWAARLSIDDYDHVNSLVVKEKLDRLNALAEPLIKQGIEVSTHLHQGRTSTELVRHVLREGNDLLMRVTKGRESREVGFFGRTANRLLRKCPCPLWLMQPNSSFDYKQILACVDTSTDDAVEQELGDLICKLAAEVSSYHETRYSIVHAWMVWNEGMLKNRMNKADFESMLARSKDHQERQFAKFLERHDGNLGDENVHLVKGDAHHVIPALARELSADLIVMGTVGKSGIFGTMMGNTAESILKRVASDVLTVKPRHFKCPILADT